jgi:hypothetical protein
MVTSPATLGAVNTPSDEMLPALVLQVTAGTGLPSKRGATLKFNVPPGTTADVFGTIAKERSST